MNVGVFRLSIFTPSYALIDISIEKTIRLINKMVN